MTEAGDPLGFFKPEFINRVDDLLIESLSGFAAAHRDLVALHLEPNYLTRAHKPQSKVALISGGGSGHEPLHTGFIGYGMLDAACPGHVFTSPTPDQMLAAAEAVENGKGVLFIVKNYAGDIMNFEMAAEMLPFENATVITSDDVAVLGPGFVSAQAGGIELGPPPTLGQHAEEIRAWLAKD